MRPFVDSSSICCCTNCYRCCIRGSFPGYGGRNWSDPEENITMQIIGYMTSHRKQHLEATDVAREFGYGREHFCRLFRKATGKNVQRISDRPAIGRRLQKTVRFLCVDSQHRKGMRFPRYARAADGRATQIRHTRAGIPRTIRKYETNVQREKEEI